MKDKLEQATREKEIAKIDVDEKIKEQEAVKMIRFKVGFNKVVVGYLDLAEKVSKNDISYKNLSKYILVSILHLILSSNFSSLV